MNVYRDKPIVMLAHMDVVDALPKDWERAPFTLTEEDGYFYGRGTIDNKLGIAMLTRAFAEEILADLQLPGLRESLEPVLGEHLSRLWGGA